MGENLEENNISPKRQSVPQRTQQVNYSPETQGSEVPTNQDTQIGNESFKLPSAGVFVKQALKVYKSRFWTLLGLSIFPIALLFIFITLITFLSALLPSPFNFIILFVIFLLPAILMFWAMIAMIFVIKSKEKINIFSVLKVSFPKAFSFLWVSFLVNLVIAGGMIPLIIPGIILSIALALSSYVFVVEGKKGFSALLRSSSLTKGFRWAIFWRNLVLGVFILILAIPFFIALLFLGEARAELIKDIASGAMSMLMLPVVLAFGYLIFEKLSQIRPIEQFSPSKKSKGLYVFLSIWGILAIVLILASPYIVLLLRTRSLGDSVMLNAPYDDNSLVGEESVSQANLKTAYARDAQRLYDIQQIRIVLEDYFIEEGVYPTSIELSKSIDDDFVLNILVTTSTESINFRDPLYEKGWYYGYVSNGENYTLTAKLERDEPMYCDKEEKEKTGMCIYKKTGF